MSTTFTWVIFGLGGRSSDPSPFFIARDGNDGGGGAGLLSAGSTAGDAGEEGILLPPLLVDIGTTPSCPDRFFLVSAAACKEAVRVAGAALDAPVVVAAVAVAAVAVAATAGVSLSWVSFPLPPSAE